MLALNLTIRFLIELCALIGLGYWGYSTGGGTAGHLLLAVAAPAAAGLAWGAFVAPRRMVATAPLALRLAVELAVIGAAAAGLYTAGAHAVAIALAAMWAVNIAWLRLLGQRPGEPPP
jgi:hypothetical protein